MWPSRRVVYFARLHAHQGDLAQFGREICGRQVYVEANAQDDVLHVIDLGAQFHEAAGHLFSVDQEIIRPFDLHGQIGLGSDPSRESGGGGNGHFRSFLRPQIRTEQN